MGPDLVAFSLREEEESLLCGLHAAGDIVQTNGRALLVEDLNRRLLLLPFESLMSTQGGYDAATLWQILSETARALPMYKYHKRYVERSILPEKPQISAKEMALLMDMPFGEAIIILQELRPASKSQPATGIGGKPSATKNLLDYSNG